MTFQKVERVFDVNTICATLMWAKVQFHISHIQTNNFAEHNAMDTFYNEVTDLADDITECLLGRLGGRLAHCNLEKIDVQMRPLVGIEKLCIFADQLFSYGTMSNYQDIANLAAELQQLLNKTKYRLSLC